MDVPREPRKKTGRNVLMVAGTIAIGSVGTALARLEPASPILDRNTLIIDSVVRGDVSRDIRGTGSLVPEQIRWITAQASARVERLASQAGQQVEANDLLLELSNPDLQIQTMQAEQQVQQAQIDLLNLRTSLRSQLLAQEGVVAAMRTQFVSASQLAAAADSLIGRKLIAPYEARIAKAQAEEYTTRLRVETDRLTLLAESIDTQIAVQAKRVLQLQAIAENQNSRLRSLLVRAPESGVLQDFTLQLGQWVPEGTALAKVVQPRRLKAVLRIPESQAKDVQVGQKALIDTRNGLIPGHVARKDPSALGGTVTVDVALDGALPSGAVPDLTVDGTITIERMENVLHTGRPSFGTGGTTLGLFKVVDGGDAAIRVPVELGRTSVNSVEIVRGLRAGDRVILSDMTPFAGAERVRIR
jgi:multidrug efflux pump subunit AcrA (membrane-fusion protein)